ncbi:CRISPR-associated protein Cas3 [Rhodomicrobium udaipurense JA643]|uniref:CRISPR-associated helicase/endonuclease Cas3 n=1 Tax=Rhodomicrobium udaipurense TaxID=1202716 RepID=A0A8I1GHS4_9HYPH|nr:CRISPR-associated helicase/endonuclease Cas3 [Rhodomicrobium udaipurense]KAI95305.1 CRISPR-associated protein Cas3 [Rhodomicrobium udaipurense JA643]MBJ7544431.1 CRISPR-associated helicase/endonuclease Cas3 [Rhodomicrobium udaipurense]
MDIFSFWAKSQLSADGSLQLHALPCHLLDVAAVADVLLERFPKRLERLAALLDSDPQALRGLIVRLAALHDLGKFHPDFQSKLPDRCAEELRRFTGTGEAPLHHTLLGFEIADRLRLATRFEAQLPAVPKSAIRLLLTSVMSHHGRPMERPANATHWRRSVETITPPINDFIDRAFALIPCSSPVLRGEPSASQIAAFSWALAGLVVLADWIGSNEDYFKYRKTVDDLSDYWLHARSQAAEAVEKAGLMPASAREAFHPSNLLPKGRGRAELSPLQKAAAAIPIAAGPNLFIVEDMTGAGKTEAALILAERLLAADAASGIYFALPTMATSNAMYGRMAGVYRGLFAQNAAPSLVLAHGRRDLDDRFTGSILDADTLKPVSHPASEDNETAQHACASWIADDRRKAFFAHVGVGTVDQALLSVLPRKYQALRLWALADRVLIVDEAHSYDAYVSRELERLIEFHAALGGSTIILSATLAEDTRNRLVNAWRKGSGGEPALLSSAAYPLITAVARGACEEMPVDARKELCRSVPVRRIATFDEAVAHVVAFARDGAPVAWIRNAVDDAIEACEALEKAGLEPLLLHARFAMGDRIDREAKIQTMLGRDSTPEQRRGFVLVGTQILEQSLDYDVDAMVSDLAPVDLIIQRAGRLWRHPGREGRLAPRELLIFSPDTDGAVDADWYRGMSPRAAAVYDHHGFVWRSAGALFDAGEIRAPEGLRDLIAKVYGTDAPEFPPALEAASMKAEAKAMSGKSMAEINLLTLEKGYGGDNAGWTSDVEISTRLEDGPSVTFRLARLAGGAVVPWCKPTGCCAAALRRAWALSEVRVQERLAKGVPEPEGELARAIDAAKKDWGKWEQEIPLLLLERGEGEPWRGVVLRKDGPATALYDDRLGLRFEA